MSDPAAVLGLEPEDLDGHTIDELTDYLEHGRTPAEPSIDNSPACQIALGALQRLQDLAGTLLDVPDTDAPSIDQNWITAVLAAIPVDARAGRHFPWPTNTVQAAAYTTEGAVRGLIRAVGDDVPGLLVGSVRIGSGVPTPIDIDVALVHGTRLVDAVTTFRSTLRSALQGHLPFALGAINVTVVGLIEIPTPRTKPRTT
jgi:hypothetical protein